MGALVFPVKDLLPEPQLVLDQWYRLDGALPESEILLRAELKVKPELAFKDRWLTRSRVWLASSFARVAYSILIGIGDTPSQPEFRKSIYGYLCIKYCF